MMQILSNLMLTFFLMSMNPSVANAGDEAGTEAVSQEETANQNGEPGSTTPSSNSESVPQIKNETTSMGQSHEDFKSVITPFQAMILGLVEGITEYLPVSSTGHLVIASELIGVRDESRSKDEIEAVEAFEIVIQGGAILAVLLLYFGKLKLMILGLLGKSQEGLRLFVNIVAAFVPTAVLGLLFNKVIKEHLQHPGPVIGALAVGGIFMIWFDRSDRAQNARRYGKNIGEITIGTAIAIGLFQSIAMWPGTSRSMMTIMGGMLLGLNPIASAEFSFLLGLPTLLAATLFKSLKEGHVLLAHVSPSSMALGLIVAAVSALLAVRGFVSWLNKHGLAPFGYYRILIAIVLIFILGGK